MDTANWKFHDFENNFIVEDWGLLIVNSAEYVSTGYINDGSTIDQRQINDGSMSDVDQSCINGEAIWCELEHHFLENLASTQKNPNIRKCTLQRTTNVLFS